MKRSWCKWSSLFSFWAEKMYVNMRIIWNDFFPTATSPPVSASSCSWSILKAACLSAQAISAAIGIVDQPNSRCDLAWHAAGTSSSTSIRFCDGNQQSSKESSINTEDEWALAYIVDNSSLQALGEAIDDDASGFITIAEINNFTAAAPDTWRWDNHVVCLHICICLTFVSLYNRLPHWLAYWAVGLNP